MKRLIVTLIPLFFVACCLIDDDLSVCGEELVIDYDLQLHTELCVQLQTELASETEAPVRRALEKWLAPVFTDRAKDIDLRFYSEVHDDISHQIKEDINDNRTSYTIKLPKENYMHLAVANIDDNREVSMKDGGHSATMQLNLPDKQEVNSLNTGVFTARLPMEVNDSVRRFDVHLYMVTAAVALVIDTTGCDSIQSISGTMIGSACGFSVCDSTFFYNVSPRLLFDNVPIDVASAPVRRAMAEEASHYACLSTVGLATKDDSRWTVDVTTTLTGDRHTTTTLTINEPLKAGTLRIVRLKMDGKGGMDPEKDNEVGATVTLDWKEGGGHEVEI